MSKNIGIFGTDLDQPSWKVLNEIRDNITQARGMLHDFQHHFKGWSDRTQSVEGTLTCAISSLYHSVEEIRQHAFKQKNAISFSPRGIGLDVCPCCFVCGAKKRNEGKDTNSYLNNVAAFVKSKEDGEKLATMFGQGVRLDYRPSEPNWIQLKIGGCDAHLANLRKLIELSEVGGVNQEDIQAAKDFS